MKNPYLPDDVETPEPPKAPPPTFMYYTDHLRLRELEDFDTIRIDEDIDDETTCAWLREINRLIYKGAKIIHLHINSSGGGVYNAFALHDAIREASRLGVKVEAIVDGYAASAAAMIVLQAADRRLCHPHARFLLHEIRRWVFMGVEKASELSDEVAEMKACTEMVKEVLASRCNHTLDEVQEMIQRKETWLSAQQAKEWGLVDGIL